MNNNELKEKIKKNLKEEIAISVSYTHLDVYKRQYIARINFGNII